MTANNNLNNLPYRLGVGMMIINQDKHILIGKRIDTKKWQMPQGGIDTGEMPVQALFREMAEEIGSMNCTILAESVNWYSYDLPIGIRHKVWNGQYKGQCQKWFLLSFHGDDAEINLKNNEYQEFIAWKWTTSYNLLKTIVNFKKTLYKAIMQEFKLYLI